MENTGPQTAPTEFIGLLDNEHEAPLAKYQYETQKVATKAFNKHCGGLKL